MAAVAPGSTITRSTEIKRRPFYVPWGNDGKGAVKLLPADHTHNSMLLDNDGLSTPYYQSKQMIPLNLMEPEHKAHTLFAGMCKRAVERADRQRTRVPQWVPPSILDSIRAEAADSSSLKPVSAGA